MGQGAAIPHARFEELRRPVAAFARLKRPVEFAAVDGLPVDLIWLLLLPPTSSGSHLDALALAARSLRSSKVRAEARKARDIERRLPCARLVREDGPVMAEEDQRRRIRTTMLSSTRWSRPTVPARPCSA